MENNNGKGIFYGVIGVATLVVAIIGATFAYFSATKEVNNVIKGEAATAGLELAVTNVSTDATGKLVPLKSADLQTGLTGVGGKSCVDSNGNTVCQVYKISVKNTGTATAILDGTISLTGGTFSNLKWAEITGPTTAGTPTVNASTTTAFKSNLSLAVSPTATDYYIAVFIDETTTAQDDTDKGSFTGTVTFNTASGTGVTATFTA